MTGMKPVSKAEVDAALEMSADPAQLQLLFVTFPATLAHWNSRQADAYETASLLKAELEREEARLSMLWREMLIAQGEKPTKDFVDNKVRVDPSYTKARVAWIEADAYRIRVQGVVDALHAKHDMLISVGANIRKEFPTPSISARTTRAIATTPDPHDKDDEL